MVKNVIDPKSRTYLPSITVQYVANPEEIVVKQKWSESVGHNSLRVSIMGFMLR